MRVLKQPALNALRGALFLRFEIDLSVGPVSPRAVCAAKLQEGERAALSHPSFLVSPFQSPGSYRNQEAVWLCWCDS